MDSILLFNIIIKILWSLIKFIAIILCFLNFNHNKIEIDLDNELPPEYEKNVNYYNYSTDIKPIAIYYPEFNNINNNYNYKININQNYQNFEYQNKNEKIKSQIELAKSHGIYGFAICFVFEFNSTYLNEINIFFLNNKEIKFPFLLFWKNNNLNNLYNSIKNKNNNENEIIHIIFEELVNEIHVFMINELYIKIHNKPILAIENSLIFDNTKLLILRKEIKKRGICDIFIIFPFENHKMMNISQKYDAIYDLPKYEFFNNSKIKFHISIYYGIIYKNIILNSLICDHILFRNSLIETNFSSKGEHLRYYNPEKFYVLNKIIIDWTKKNYNRTKGFFFLSSWNDYENGNYLEPDIIYGYASLNSFSKALFNLSFNENNYNYLYLNNSCIIAIQAHIFFEDLTFEIINKTNNIPFKYDLFVTTVSEDKKKYIEKIIKQYSFATNYKIDIVENKGRDVLPFIIQMKNIFKNYKYICHLHSKKTMKFSKTGILWRRYLYNNLLGNKDIIFDIINDFEIHTNLGMIFPDTYYNIFKGVKNFESIDFKHHKENIKYINYVFTQMFKKYKIGKKLIFPAGDMFWARTEAIYQIFEIKFINKFPKELGQLNKTFMHAIERLWLYIIKLNGYYYKTIFKIC